MTCRISHFQDGGSS